MARPGEVWVTAETRRGLDHPAVARGEHVLRGLPGRWPLFAVAG